MAEIIARVKDEKKAVKKVLGMIFLKRNWSLADDDKLTWISFFLVFTKLRQDDE